MVTISSTSQPSHTTLSLFGTRPPSQVSNTVAMTAGPNPMGRSVSPSVSDALLRIKEIIDGDRILDMAEVAKQHGASRATIAAKEPYTAAQFHSVVTSLLSETKSQDASFQRALKEGTLKIVHATDVDGPNFTSSIVDLWDAAGHHIGMATSNTPREPSKYLSAQREAGLNVASGWVGGHDFYAVWPK